MCPKVQYFCSSISLMTSVIFNFQRTACILCMRMTFATPALLSTVRVLQSCNETIDLISNWTRSNNHLEFNEGESVWMIISKRAKGLQYNATEMFVNSAKLKRVSEVNTWAFLHKMCHLFVTCALVTCAVTCSTCIYVHVHACLHCAHSHSYI